MKNLRDSHNLSFASLAAVGLALVVTGGTFAWVTINKLTSSTSNPNTPIATNTYKPVKPAVVESHLSTQKQLQQKTAKPQQHSVAVYWLKLTPTETKLQPMPVSQQKSNDKNQLLTEAFKELLAGPNDPNYTTTIPEGTKLLGLKVDKKGVHVDLSEEFNADGGSAEMIGRLAQVIYTATSFDPKIPVWISVGGKPLELLGEGQGLMVDQPMTQQLFIENFQL
ncbi:GerMN domain-containing protein [Gloeothece verrucosa]|uniref:Lipoprotein LpqB, GerMN domain protein n=1 Tax=Gloeothece verrucosa (strain PCC 7822) TaxID=497965 RepID=E0UF23_GLOV7|nr:GerMN domain-containing protein [Gloeothece verrucosa]ADN14275.1 Lipoprotein LpqB, GerMN domain protein [Gloeothece verrucosa PCC 7822]